MANEDVALMGGAKLHVTSAPFPDAWPLAQALMGCYKGLPFTKDMLQMDMAVFKDALINALTSPSVETALFRCMERATYENVKVTRDLFDDPKLGDRARGDLLEIQYHVVRVNCSPFFVKAFSWLRERFAMPAAAPASK